MNVKALIQLEKIECMIDESKNILSFIIIELYRGDMVEFSRGFDV